MVEVETMITGTDLDRPSNLRKVLPSRGTKRFIPCVPGVHNLFSLLIHWNGSSLCSVRMKHVSLSPLPPPVNLVMNTYAQFTEGTTRKLPHGRKN